MPLLIICQDGRYGPAIFCDHCGERIDRIDDGNYHYKMDGAEAGGAPVFFTHRRCCVPFERAARSSWGAMELGTLFAYLANSLGLDLEEERAKASLMAQFDL